MNERGHLSSETLDLLHLAALQGDAEHQAREHLAGCGACRAAFDEIAADAERFDKEILPRQLPKVRDRLERSERHPWARWSPRFFPYLGLAAAAATVALVVLVRPGPSDDLRVKGGAAIQAFAKRGERVFAVRPDTTVAAGDRIRLVVEPAGHPYLLVVGRDGRGRFTTWYPAAGTQSARVPAGGELPGSIELDDAPGQERLFAYFTDAPIQASEATAAIGRDPERGALRGVPGPTILVLDKGRP